MVVKCPECDRENPEGTQICTYCGAMIVAQGAGGTVILPDTDYEEGVPKWGTARFRTQHLVITVQHTEHQFVFDADEVEELLIGRPDTATGEVPHIDLTNDDGLEKGISRKHAAIVRHEGSLQIVDLGTPNGTFLNGQKLVPNQPRVLRDGDDVRLAHMRLNVNFVDGNG